MVCILCERIFYIDYFECRLLLGFDADILLNFLPLVWLIHSNFTIVRVLVLEGWCIERSLPFAEKHFLLKKLAFEIYLALLVETTLSRCSLFESSVSRHVLARVGSRWINENITSLLRASFCGMPCWPVRSCHSFV